MSEQLMCRCPLLISLKYWYGAVNMIAVRYGTISGQLPAYWMLTYTSTTDANAICSTLCNLTHLFKQKKPLQYNANRHK